MTDDIENIVYERLTVAEYLFELLRHGQKRRVYYFYSSKVLDLLVGIVGNNWRLKRITPKLSEVRENENGRSYYVRLDVMLLELTKKGYAVFSEDPLVKCCCGIFGQREFELYLEKYLGGLIKTPLLEVLFIKWFFDKAGYEGRTFFVTVKKINKLLLGDYSRTKFNVYIEYSFSLSECAKNIAFFCSKIIDLAGKVARALFNSGVSAFGKASNGERETNGVIGVNYTGIGITFEPDRRCDFPWLQRCNVPEGKVLVYFRRKNVPVTGEMLALLRSRGIRYLKLLHDEAVDKKIPSYRASGIFLGKIMNCAGSIFPFMVKSILRQGGHPGVLTAPIIDFISAYSLAHDYFRTNKIIINIDRMDVVYSRVAERLALVECGGINISYQLSNAIFPALIYGTNADVMFLFGPANKKAFVGSGMLSENILYCGYLTDYSFQHVDENAGILRRRMMGKGAKFIVSYFDEHASDSMFSMTSSLVGTKVYQELFEYVFKTPEVGLICSPKNASGLVERLPGLRGPLEKIKECGRIYFDPGRGYKPNVYPVEYGKASDIVITLLAGGTVGLENLLAGNRTIFLDLEGCYEYPEYLWGKDVIVFDNIDVMLDKVEGLRNGRKDCLDIGDIKYYKDIDSRDPFRDGRAAERMGSYIGHLYEKMSSGNTRDTAISYANEKYVEKWGRDSIG
ncbi:MAG: hypothetical protein HQL30_03315 [Candidatus Omnitrophica bacterium]|nr:hypothetical protein [Candidatus Omnitrophota bacterium]